MRSMGIPEMYVSWLSAVNARSWITHEMSASPEGSLRAASSGSDTINRPLKPLDTCAPVRW